MLTVHRARDDNGVGPTMVAMPGTLTVVVKGHLAVVTVMKAAAVLIINPCAMMLMAMMGRDHDIGLGTRGRHCASHHLRHGRFHSQQDDPRPSMNLLACSRGVTGSQMLDNLRAQVRDNGTDQSARSGVSWSGLRSPIGGSLAPWL